MGDLDCNCGDCGDCDCKCDGCDCDCLCDGCDCNCDPCDCFPCQCCFCARNFCFCFGGGGGDHSDTMWCCCLFPSTNFNPTSNTSRGRQNAASDPICCCCFPMTGGNTSGTSRKSKKKKRKGFFSRLCPCFGKPQIPDSSSSSSPPRNRPKIEGESSMKHKALDNLEGRRNEGLNRPPHGDYRSDGRWSRPVMYDEYSQRHWKH